MGEVSRYGRMMGVLGASLWLAACGGGGREPAAERDGCAAPAPVSEVGWAGCAGCRPATLAAPEDGARRPLLEDVPFDDASPPAEPEAPSEDRAEPTTSPGEQPLARFFGAAKRPLAIRTQADSDAALRGRIGKGRAFRYETTVPGPGCPGAMWARLGEHAYVCLADARPAEPHSDADETLYYARLRKTHPAPRWASLAELERGAAPLDELAPDHDYAFVARKQSRNQAALIDRRGRVVLERDVQRFVPSTFQGRDLQAHPVPPGKTLAWVVAWPGAPVRTDGVDDVPGGPTVRYQTELLLETQAQGSDPDWLQIDDLGAVEARAVRQWSPEIPRPTHMKADEVWIDVDLGRQILTVLAGDEPIFVTLVSSGLRSPTPRGVFRIQHKLVADTMESAPGDADVYEVEAVPFVQYFAGGYALHGAYWHNRFGRPLSHGCVNLSPADAKHVFSLTAPHLGGGWAEAYETVHERGTVVQIRKGEVSPTDRRRDPVFVLVDG